MGPGGPNMAAIGMFMILILLCAIACWGIAWRLVICTKKIYLLPWYFSHPIAIGCGLITAITYCLLILFSLEYMPFSVREALGFIGVLISVALPVPIAFFVALKKGLLSTPQ